MGCDVFVVAVYDGGYADDVVVVMDIDNKSNVGSTSEDGKGKGRCF